MHELFGVGDDAAERLGDRLVAEADAEQRLPGASARLHDGDRHARVGGLARARARPARRRTRRGAAASVGLGEVVVAHDVGLGTQLRR